MDGFRASDSTRGACCRIHRHCQNRAAPVVEGLSWLPLLCLSVWVCVRVCVRVYVWVSVFEREMHGDSLSMQTHSHTHMHCLCIPIRIDTCTDTCSVATTFDTQSGATIGWYGP